MLVIHDMAKAAGLDVDTLLKAATSLCHMHGRSPVEAANLESAIAEIVRFRQVERAVHSALE